MNREATKSAILNEWRNWKTANMLEGETPSGTHALEFHAYLQRERPELLGFRYRGGRKYQLIKGWLAYLREIRD
jgi:hypothetical protein